MSTTAIDGVAAAGRVPTWIIQPAQIATDPTTGAMSIPLAALTHATTVKTDCYMDPGDLSVSRTPTTRTRQRLCQTVAQTITTGETIDVTLTAVFDQQEALTEDVNLVYAALPKDADVYIAQAFGWDSGVTPTTATVIDLVKGKVQTRSKNQPTTPDEDLKFQSVISGSAFWEDVTLSA